MNATQRAITEAHQAGTCRQAELAAELEQLARQLSQALEDQREAGYTASKYVHDHLTDHQQLLERKRAAQDMADASRSTLWHLFYDVASKVAPKPHLSCSCSTRMAAAHLAERGQA